MKLAKLFEKGRKVRIGLLAAAGPLVLEVLPLTPEAHKTAGSRLGHLPSKRGYLPSAHHVEFNDEDQILTFWLEGRGVTLEIAGYVPYAAILSIEPLD